MYMHILTLYTYVNYDAKHEKTAQNSFVFKRSVTLRVTQVPCILYRRVPAKRADIGILQGTRIFAQ